MLINVREELAQANIGRFHIRFAILMGLILFFDGYNQFNAAYVIPLVRESWHLSPLIIGIMLSSSVAGTAIGSVLQGVLADRIGRRRVMLFALWVLPFTSILLATLVASATSFIFVRFLMGGALGIITPLALTCINEWAPRRNANTFAIWIFQLGFSAGGIFAGIASMCLTPLYGWQSLFIVSGLSALVAMASLKWLPESAQYLTLKGRYDEVLILLRKVRPERVGIYADALIEPMRKTARIGTISALLSPQYRRSTIVQWIVGGLSLFCINGLTGWLPSLVLAKGQALSSAFWFGTLVMTASVFGGVLMGWVADRLRSRIRTMVIGYALAAICMASLAMTLSQPVGIAFIALVGFFIFGTHAVLNNYQAMMYRTEVRSTGMGVAVGLNRLGGVMGPVIVGLLASADPDPFYVFMVFSGLLILASIVIALGNVEVGSLSASDLSDLARVGSPDSSDRTLLSSTAETEQ